MEYHYLILENDLEKASHQFVLRRCQADLFLRELLSKSGSKIQNKEKQQPKRDIFKEVDQKHRTDNYSLATKFI